MTPIGVHSSRGLGGHIVRILQGRHMGRIPQDGHIGVILTGIIFIASAGRFGGRIPPLRPPPPVVPPLVTPDPFLVRRSALSWVWGYGSLAGQTLTRGEESRVKLPSGFGVHHVCILNSSVLMK